MIQELIVTIWFAAILILSITVATFAAIWAIMYIIRQIQLLWYEE